MMVGYTIERRRRRDGCSRWMVSRLLAVAVLMAGVGLAGCRAEPSSPVVTIPDAAFSECLLDKVYWGQVSSGPVTVAQLNHLTDGVSCMNQGVGSIEGAQYLTGLDGLTLRMGQISDLTPLAGLTELTFLDLGTNDISDINALAGLTNLTGLHLDGNPISDLAPLAGLTGLTEVGLGGDRISDLAPLTHLTGLTAMNLSQNRIDDVSVLAGLTGLTSLSLSGNRIGDVSVLAGLPAVQATTGRSGNLWCNLDGQRLDATARVGGPQPLPEVVGLGTISWWVDQGDAVIDGGSVTYPSAGTVSLGFADSASTFGGTVTVTVTS